MSDDTFGNEPRDDLEDVIWDLYYGEGHTQKEIADLLDVNVGKVAERTTLVERGFKNQTEYQTYLAQQKGFKNQTEYQTYLAQQKGFKNLAEYHTHLAQQTNTTHT